MSDAMTFFDASVFLITFILLGRLLESWSKRRTGDAVAALGALRPSRGLLLLDPAAGSASKLRELDVALLELGDLVLVPAGASPPLDSVLADERTALFDESSLTGESVPAKKQAGDQLFAGTANASAHPVIARVSALPGEQLLDGILDVVRSASGRKASIERIADRVTSVFVPVVIYIAVSCTASLSIDGDTDSSAPVRPASCFSGWWCSTPLHRHAGFVRTRRIPTSQVLASCTRCNSPYRSSSSPAHAASGWRHRRPSSPASVSQARAASSSMAAARRSNKHRRPVGAALLLFSTRLGR